MVAVAVWVPCGVHNSSEDRLSSIKWAVRGVECQTCKQGSNVHMEHQAEMSKEPWGQL